MQQGEGAARGELPEGVGDSRTRVLTFFQSEAGWPEEEIEWMATTAFNHAIDCYSAHETERSKEWAGKAINLAHYCSDPRLEEILQGKYLRLSFDKESG